MTSPDDMKTDVAGWTVPTWQEENRQAEKNIVYSYIHISCSLCQKSDIFLFKYRVFQI